MKLKSKILLIIAILFTFSSSSETLALENLPLSVKGSQLKYTKINYAFQLSDTASLDLIYGSTDVLNLGITNDLFLIQLDFQNQSKDPYELVISNPNIDSLILYSFKDNQVTVQYSGDKVANKSKRIVDPYHKFRINSGNFHDRLYLIAMSSEQLVLPISVHKIGDDYSNRTLFYGIFSGVILALFLYNLVLAFLVREQVYYMYVIYLFSIYFAQSNLIGLSSVFFGNFPNINHASLYFFSSIVGLSAIRFMEKFLDLHLNLPKSIKFVRVGYLLYILLLVLSLFNPGTVAYIVMQLNGVYAAVIALSIGLILTIRSNILAKFYLVAWSVFSLGIIIFVLKDYNILPYNNFTRLTMTYGVIAEVILLSIALAHRINTLKKDNEHAQERIIEEMSRNESLITNQNIVLEDKVRKRTEELERTLTNLKQAQVKLIDSEKMASLGLLTAGIAHEINNPINYVTANVIPLRENIDMLTQLVAAYKGLTKENFDSELEQVIEMEKSIELDYTLKETAELIDGIEEGAKRTYQIVDGLKTFSRSDATNMQRSDVNLGIESTLAVLKSQLKPITVEKSLATDIPEINCQLGKLNQVFLNLINNAIHAIEARFGEGSKEGKIQISSIQEGGNVVINIHDNGIGIPEEMRHKIFEPFYTSKPIGEGTGLGLSISYSIIEDHKGDLTFDSVIGEGTTFTIRLPLD